MGKYSIADKIQCIFNGNAPLEQHIFDLKLVSSCHTKIFTHQVQGHITKVASKRTQSLPERLVVARNILKQITCGLFYIICMSYRGCINSIFAPSQLQI